MHALLGTKKRQPMALLTVDRRRRLRRRSEDAAKKKAAGFTAFKIKVGIDSADKDAARTRDICKVLGPGFLISADANQGFDTRRGLRSTSAP